MTIDDMIFRLRNSGTTVERESRYSYNFRTCSPDDACYLKLRLTTGGTKSPHGLSIYTNPDNVYATALNDNQLEALAEIAVKFVAERRDAAGRQALARLLPRWLMEVEVAIAKDASDRQRAANRALEASAI